MSLLFVFCCSCYGKGWQRLWVYLLPWLSFGRNKSYTLFFSGVKYQKRLNQQGIKIRKFFFFFFFSELNGVCGDSKRKSVVRMKKKEENKNSNKNRDIHIPCLWSKQPRGGTWFPSGTFFWGCFCSQWQMTASRIPGGDGRWRLGSNVLVHGKGFKPPGSWKGLKPSKKHIYHGTTYVYIKNK